MVVFPLIAFVVSAACGLILARDSWRHPKPDRIVWAIAFGIFAAAAGAEVIGSLNGWTAPLARIYYLGGAVLVVGYLALGELYLLARPKIERFAPGVALLVTAVAATLVLNTPVDNATLPEDGWDALDKSPALVGLTISINTIGTLILVGGALYSAWRFRKLGIQRHRMIGCVLIALGTVVVAMGGTLTRLGHHEYLYIAMSIGVVIIFAGILETRRIVPEQVASFGPTGKASAAAETARSPRLVSLPARTTATPAVQTAAITYIVEKLLPLEPAAIEEACRQWSAPAMTSDALTRDEARRVWRLRLALPLAAQDRFDSLPVSIQGQLAELHAEVLTNAETVARSG